MEEGKNKNNTQFAEVPVQKHTTTESINFLFAYFSLKQILHMVMRMDFIYSWGLREPWHKKQKSFRKVTLFPGVYNNIKFSKFPNFQRNEW